MSVTGHRKSERTIKQVIQPLSKQHLKENCRRHNKACREGKDRKPDLVFTDNNVKTHSFARGPVAVDGAGDVRAYGHKITGSQHCLVVFSLLTGDVLYVKHHQISCGKCSRVLSKLIEERGSADIPLCEVTHEQKCFRNTTHTPATAEEDACQSAGLDLLKGADGEFRDDDEAIFCDQVISDGDTKGRNKIMNVQFWLIGEVAIGLAEGFPSIEHLIKCVSNAYYTLSQKDSTLRGVGLLVPARIKAIACDVNSVIRLCNLCLDAVSTKQQKNLIGTEEAETKRQEILNECLNNLYAIIPHHCGDHRNCSGAFCKYQQIKRALEMRETKYGTPFTKLELTDAYVKCSRFKGAILGAKGAGRSKLEKVIQDRINAKNIAKVARVFTSNFCENFFMILTKYSQGKRINLGMTDSWEVYQLFCAGMCSNERNGSIFVSKVIEALGIRPSSVRDQYTLQANKKAKSNALGKRTDQSKKRRQLTQVKKTIRVNRETAKKECHKTERMKPKDDIRPRVQKKRAPSKCGNCSEVGHTARQCPEPSREKQKKDIGIPIAYLEGLLDM